LISWLKKLDIWQRETEQNGRMTTYVTAPKKTRKTFIYMTTKFLAELTRNFIFNQWQFKIYEAL